MMDFRKAWNKGEVEAGALLDEIERLSAELSSLRDVPTPAPTGWRLVPVLPDEHMLDAAFEAHDMPDDEEEAVYRAEFERTYRAMIGAATSRDGPACHDEVEHPDLEILVQYVTELKEGRDCRGDDCYPVLGSDGSEFVIEVAAGDFADRVIKRSIYVSVEQPCGPAPVSVQRLGKTEDAVHLPDPAHLVALLGLFERAFHQGTRVLHPLDRHGDFLPGWCGALRALGVNSSN